MSCLCMCIVSTEHSYVTEISKMSTAIGFLNDLHGVNVRVEPFFSSSERLTSSFLTSFYIFASLLW